MMFLDYLRTREAVNRFSRMIDVECNSWCTSDRLGIEIFFGYVYFASTCLFAARRTQPQKRLARFANGFRYKMAHGYMDNLPVIYDGLVEDLEKRFGKIPCVSEETCYRFSAQSLIGRYHTDENTEQGDREIENTFVTMSARLQIGLFGLLKGH